MSKNALLSVLILSIACSAQGVQQLKKTVGFVYGHVPAKTNDGKSVVLDGALGTAFFVSYPDTRGGPNYIFIYTVTAKHVLKDELEGKYLDKVRIRVNNRNGSGVSFGEIPVSDSKGNLIWLEDKDDPNADIAVSMTHPPEDQVDYSPIPIGNFSSNDTLKQLKVAEGDSVYLVGLMPQFTGENRNYPVVRHGYIALLPDEPIPLTPNTKEQVYALELGSWPGQSGSPVFLSLGGYRNGNFLLGDSYSLLGVMLGYFQNKVPFEVSPTNSVVIGDSSNVGISYVLPASEILKVLNSKEAQQQRDADIQAKIDTKPAPTP